MLRVEFNAGFAARCFRLLEEGKPIEPLGESWTRDEALTLAGVLLQFTIVKRASDRDVDVMPFEWQEAVINDEAALAITAISHACAIASSIGAGKYLEHFHPVVIFTVTQDGDATVIDYESGMRDDE